MSKNSQVDLARLAAYVDGEGTIGIDKKMQKDRAYSGYSIRLIVSNSAVTLINWLSENFGGKVYPQDTLSPKGKRKIVYQWKVSGAHAFKLIQQIRTFLIIKGEQADLASEFYLKFSRWNSGRGRRWKRPVWLVERQEEYYQQMKELNKKGVERSEVVASGPTRR